MNRPLIPAVAVLLAVALPALAVIPRFWETRTYEEWRLGDLAGTSVTGDGELALAPSFAPVYDTDEPLVFSAASDGDGNVYLGTGHLGRIFRVDEEGVGVLVADFGELDVLALAPGPDGAMYAATSPNGRVYRIDGEEEPEVFFDPEALYIWDLQFDAAGRLLVATGEDGVIYRVDGDGDGQVFYDSDNTHILSLALDADGQVLAGGSPGGYVYRISDEGRAFVLYDSGMEEVRMIAPAPDGRIYAAVLDGEPSGEVTGNGSENGAQGSGVRSRILEILPEGAVRAAWESTSEMVFSILPMGDELYFSTGTRGRVYALGDRLSPDLLVESADEQTTRLIRSGERILATSSNRGRLWELGASDQALGTYESEVRDTGAISTWGRLSWSGRGALIETRSGNTSRPDSTWSDWASPGPSGEILSPPARFIQWRGRLSSDEDTPEPTLSSVTLPYLQQNFRPEVRQVEVLEPGLALRPQTSAAGPTPQTRSGTSGRIVRLLPRSDPRTEIAAGAQSVRWTANDRNDDDLEYSLFYRSENEGDWKLLAGGLDEPFYTIEPDTLPDGMYLVRVVAGDGRSNPPEDALEGERVTPPFAIDQTPPAVVVTGELAGEGRVRLEATATDMTSTLKVAAMSVDGGEWRPVFPLDGIIDSLSEEFVFSAGPLPSGERVIAFRIYDQNENVGIGKTIVRIP